MPLLAGRSYWAADRPPGPPGKPDADATGRVTGQVTGYQPPDETRGAEHHHVQLTVPAHEAPGPCSGLGAGICVRVLKVGIHSAFAVLF